MTEGRKTHIAIMDTTLRDGEQTPNIAYTAAEKLHVARMLLADVGVDRIEIASARVSHGELEAALRVTDWAREADMIDRVEMLGFCDGQRSVDWILEAGGRVMNLLAKGSEHHCRKHLAGYKIPRELLACELKHLPTGKIDYAWAREYAMRASTGA